MQAMGGNVQAARKLVKKMKDKQRNEQSGARKQKHQENKAQENQIEKHRYYKNQERRKEARNKRYEDNPSPERQARRKRYEDHPSPERQARRKRYRNDTGSLEDGFSRFVASGRYGPSYPCVVCHELHWQGGMMVVTLNDFDARYICREYILENKCLFLKQDNYHCCKTCKRKVEAGLMPSVAAKNNLECPWDTVPRELLKLTEVILCFILFPI